MDYVRVQAILECNSYVVKSVIDASEGVKRIECQNGVIVTCYNNGNHQVQGKNSASVQELLDVTEEAVRSKRIFVAYGHDNARYELEALLKAWDLIPLYLDKCAGNNQTIIECIEKQLEESDFGIVLWTPDDETPRNNPNEDTKFRARQNVVFETGLLIGFLGRKKVCLMCKSPETLELPSDLGMRYIDFETFTNDVKLQLYKEMVSAFPVL